MSESREQVVRTLIADDHGPTRADIREILESDERFCVCAEATDAAGAVDVALRERPNLCLLDVRMPGGGLAAAWEIGSRLPTSKLVMLTVSESDDDLFAALAAGVDGYLLKNIDRRRLPHAVWDIYCGTFTIPRQLMGRVAEAFRGSEPRRRSVGALSGPEHLTSREWQVLELLARGLSPTEIASSLFISPTTVRVHTASIVKKLRARDRDDAIAEFRRRRMRLGD